VDPKAGRGAVVAILYALLSQNDKNFYPERETKKET
jgi:hypothetical protein